MLRKGKLGEEICPECGGDIPVTDHLQEKSDAELWVRGCREKNLTVGLNELKMKKILVRCKAGSPNINNVPRLLILNNYRPDKHGCYRWGNSLRRPGRACGGLRSRIL